MAPIPDQGGSKSNPAEQDALKYVMKVKKTFQKTPEIIENFNEILNDYSISKISSQEVKDKVMNIFNGHDDLLLGFNVFLPKGHKIMIPVHHPVQTPMRPPVQFQEAQIFVNLIKTRFSAEQSVFKSFWTLMDMYRSNQKGWHEIYQEVEPLFKDHPDLLNGFMRFLPINNNFPCWQAGSHKQEDWSSDTTLQIPRPVENRRSKDTELSDPSEGDDRESDTNSKKQLQEDGTQSILHKSSDEEKKCLTGCQLLKGVDEVREEETIEKKQKRSEKRTRTPPLLAKEKSALCKPIHELDLSKCKQCTPSYRLLPEHYSGPPSRHRRKNEKSLLNDTCVLVTSGSEDYSFKHMEKNQYEERLFLCEDDRFEFDMLVELAKSTKKRIEDLIKEMNGTSTEIEIEDYLTPMNLRCIEKLYGDHGLDAIDVLREDPEAALPVLLGRLKQKLEEWGQCCTGFNKVWSDVYAKNFHKSLDHRRFKVKQQDAKNLSSKALQTETNDKHEKNSGDNTNLLEIGTRSQFSRSKLNGPDTAATFGGCNKQHNCINHSTEFIASSSNIWLPQN